MKTRSTSAFRYHFRAPGNEVEGPIRFAIGQVVPGQVLVGRSQRGICAIVLGEDTRTLHGQLAAAFPGVGLQADRLRWSAN